MADKLAVIRLSESFADYWKDLCEQVSVDLEFVEPDLALNGYVALIVSAGGEEDRGLDLLLNLPEDGLPVFLVGVEQSHRFAVEALRRGAADYFCLPGDLDLLRRSVTARVEAARARESGSHARPEGNPLDRLLGESESIHDVKRRAARVMPHSTVSVLIEGETGTGKEILARALHDGGPRADRPFVAINCAAIPDNLLESELFGHVQGAFTGAVGAKSGLFEEAHTGTIFLDEIGHLPLELQGKLLRILEDRRVRRVGATVSREVDVRVVAATHVKLERAVADGLFREDLFYRLNVVRLTLPPLRDRPGDVEILAAGFVKKFAAQYGVPQPELDEPVVAVLRSHLWPGNVRELQNAIERAILLSPPGRLDPAELLMTHETEAPEDGAGAIPTLDDVIVKAVFVTLDKHGGNKSSAARELGISRARLQRIVDRGGAEDD
ncbi:MAG: sigma-54 interaction domain-containing protein [Gemmatimonadales bacterium]